MTSRYLKSAFAQQILVEAETAGFARTVQGEGASAGLAGRTGLAVKSCPLPQCPPLMHQGSPGWAGAVGGRPPLDVC